MHVNACIWGNFPHFFWKGKKLKNICVLAPVASQVSDIPCTAIAASNQINLCGVVELYEIALCIGGVGFHLRAR